MKRRDTTSGWCAVGLLVPALAACSYGDNEQPFNPPPDAPPTIDGPPIDAPPIDGPPASEQPSCDGLSGICGPNGDESCCVALEVPGGTFHRSYDEFEGDQTAPATVSSFYLDKYEITVGRFRAFVKAGQGTRGAPPARDAGAHPAIPNSGWSQAWNQLLPTDSTALQAGVKCDATFQTWTDAPGDNEARPMGCLSWYEAMAFCAWDGGRLPTEAEWNYAASGGNEQRVFPWSSPPDPFELDPTYASYKEGDTCHGDGAPACSVADLVAAGSKRAGAGRWGHAELAGNVWEWALDWASPDYPTPCSNCAQLTPSVRRVLRGGSFFGDETFLRTIHRNGHLPDGRFFTTGARCARDKKPGLR